MDKKCFLTEKGPKALGPYSTAVAADKTVYLSGMLGIRPETGKLKEGGVLPQAGQVFENLRAVLSELGLTLKNVVKTTVFLTDMDDFSSVNALYGEAFGQDFPARTCVQVAKLPLGAAVEVECIAVR